MTSYATSGGRLGYESKEGERDWVRKDKVTYLVNRSRSIDEKKDRISAEKLLNNFNNCRDGVQTEVVN